MSETITDQVCLNDDADCAADSLAAFTAQQVRTALTPLPTVTLLVMEALGTRRGTPSSWYEPVRAALGPAGVALLGPLLGAGSRSVIPDCLVPQPAVFRPSFDDEVERIATTSPEELVSHIEANDLLDSEWSLVARAPSQWLGAYSGALQQAWGAARPLWERATPLLEREVGRVGAALARGSFDLLVDGITPKARVEDGRLYLSCQDGPVAVAPGLVMAPLVAGVSASLVTCRSDAVDFFGYPLPGARRLSEMRAHVPVDGLRALLGEPRAQILRHLDQMTTAGALAESMLYVPSAISHHLLALERAGLVDRVREGRHVVVSRTPRANALLNLYEP